MTTRLRALHVRELRIPFKVSFRHASADRAETSSAWVTAMSTAGAVGFGESCPRPYVTGETPASVAAFVKRHEAELVRTVDDVDSLRAWMGANQDAIDQNPAAWCAIELALLDVFARARGITVDAMLGLAPVRGPFRFTAVLGDSAPDVFTAQAEQYRERGFSDVKIKLSGDLGRDRAKCEVLRRVVPGVRIRADANNLWRDAQAAIDFLRALDFGMFAVEEPIGANEYRGLDQIGAALGCHIVLDESFLRADQLSDLPGPADRWLINVRVSKMGGLLRSLNVASAVRASGIGLIVGAQVGETSLLTRVALTVAQASIPSLVAQEGAFGTHLLQRDICDPPIMFGAGGVLDPVSFGFTAEPGFGIIPHTDEQTVS